MNLSDLEFLATGSEPYRYPLAYGPEGVTLEGRKMILAGTRGIVNERRCMPTLLNDTEKLLSSAYPDASPLSGSLTTNLVPLPFSENSSIKPLCSLIIFLAIMRPSPVPFDPFVLKKSLKTLL